MARPHPAPGVRVPGAAVARSPWRTTPHAGVVTALPARGRAVALLLLLGALLLLASGPAWGHAVLTDADPADGATLEAAPDRVTLTFNEPVDLPDGGLRVFDGDAQRVDEGTLDTDTDARIAAALPADLPDGGYLVVYRVLSADSHPVSGVVGFTVGAGEAVDAATTSELRGDDGGGTAIAAAVVRGVGYGATLLAAGAALFALAVARTADDRRRARRVGRPAIGAAIGAALVSWPLQAMAVTGAGPAQALRLSTLGETLGSSFGQSWLLRVLALTTLLVFWSFGGGRWPAAVAGLVAAGSFALDGHQRSMEPVALLVAGDLVHLTAGALWFGGLVLLALAVRARSLDDDPVGAARLVGRFSTLALWSVVALTVSGAAMSRVLVGAPDALTGTTYGGLLLAKVALVGAAVAVAAYNRWRLVPIITARTPAGGSTDDPTPRTSAAAASPAGADVAEAPSSGPAPVGVGTSPRARAAWRRLGGTLAAEALLLVAVLLLTGFLVVQRPAADAAGLTGLYDTTVTVTDGLELDVVVDPNRAGELNQIHLYALDATGRPSADVEDVELRLTFAEEGIGPFVVEPFPAGTGHWVAAVDELAFAGDWTVQVTLGLDRFTEERVELTVPVR